MSRVGTAALAGAAIATVGLAAAAVAASERSIPSMVEALASDDMRGRGAGSDELARAGRLVQRWLEESGLVAGHGGAWVQPFAGPAGEELFNFVGKVDGGGEEWIVVGAHYDGLGVGPPGTEHALQILNGADDNASGVAALVDIARRTAASEDLERTVFFVAFSGEELGTLGSQAFVAAPPMPLEKCVAMLNLDSVGRIEEERLIVFGTGTADEFPEVLGGVNHAFGFDLAFRTEGPGASDHTPFFAKGVPVLHFFSGATPEYHGPGDDPALLNYDGLSRLAEFVAEAVVYFARSAEPLTFRPAGAERLTARPGAKKRRVSFGSIPDFSRESGGILLAGVMPGGAAEEAGLAKGDLLVAIDGDALDTIHDFQAVLSEREPGDVVAVSFEREGEKLETKVTLRERKR